MWTFKMIIGWNSTLLFVLINSIFLPIKNLTVIIGNYNLNWRHGFQQSVMWERWNHLIVNYWSFIKLWRLCVQDHRVKTLPKTGCLLYFKQHPIRIMKVRFLTGNINKDEDYKFSLYTENLVNSISNVQCHAFVLLLTKLKIILSFFDLRFWLILWYLETCLNW
jgi:hypothetical protein